MILFALASTSFALRTFSGRLPYRKNGFAFCRKFMCGAIAGDYEHRYNKKPFERIKHHGTSPGFNDSAVFTAECRGAAVIDKLNKLINAFFNYPFLLNQNMYPFQRLSVVHSFKNPIFGIRHKILMPILIFHKLPDKA